MLQKDHSTGVLKNQMQNTFQKTRVLVVEDEEDVRNLILLQLTREGYESVGVEDSEKALALINDSTQNFDLYILDWMLPGLSGLDLCKRIAGQKPVLMVTARADTTDIVLGLEMGADDYITKPFQIAIFNSRVRALIRRSKASPSAQSKHQFEVCGLTIIPESHHAVFRGEKLEFTPSEFKALLAMARNKGVIISRQKMIEFVQGEGLTVTERAVDTMIFGLRKNLGAASSLIETVRGVGYRFAMDPI